MVGSFGNDGYGGYSGEGYRDNEYSRFTSSGDGGYGGNRYNDSEYGRVKSIREESYGDNSKSDSRIIDTGPGGRVIRFNLEKQIQYMLKNKIDRYGKDRTDWNEAAIKQDFEKCIQLGFIKPAGGREYMIDLQLAPKNFGYYFE